MATRGGAAEARSASGSRTGAAGSIGASHSDDGRQLHEEPHPALQRHSLADALQYARYARSDATKALWRCPTAHVRLTVPGSIAGSGRAWVSNGSFRNETPERDAKVPAKRVAGPV